MKIKRALISVSDKTGLLDFARGLRAAGVEILATGRSAEALRAASIPVRGIEELTQQPEILGGRVKTLAYQVFAGILFRRGEASDEREMVPLGDLAIDLVAVNFYPFEETVRSGKDLAEVNENIDIGGPSLVRAAAKNSAHVLVVTDPRDYPRVVEKIAVRSPLSELSAELAHKAWQHVAEYDHAIASYFGAALRYGENPHQPAKFVGKAIWNSLTPNAISYSNAVDLSAATDLLFSLRHSEALKGLAHTAVVVKHAGPCGVAMASSQEGSLRLAWESDPVSAFGGVIALSHPLTEGSAAFLKERFFEALTAPDLKGSECLAALLGTRKKLKAIDLPSLPTRKESQATDVLGGFLTQQRDRVEDDEVLKAAAHGGAVSDQDRKVLLFAMHCAMSLKSNAIAIAREVDGALQLIGTGQGQPNRIEALQWLAIPRAQRFGSLEKAVVASDGFFPFPDSIEVIADAGVTLVAQPGGSVQDPQVIAAAEKRKVRMLLTGKRHFKH